MVANPFMPSLLTAAEVAEMLRLRESTVKDYARRGILPCVRLGRHVRFDRDDIVEYINQQRTQTAPS